MSFSLLLIPSPHRLSGKAARDIGSFRHGLATAAGHLTTRERQRHALGIMLLSLEPDSIGSDSVSDLLLGLVLHLIRVLLLFLVLLQSALFLLWPLLGISLVEVQ